MKTRINTIICFLVCAFAAVSFSCSAGGTGSESSISRHVIITYMTTGDRPVNGATEKMLKQLNAILTKKVNAELQIYYIPWNEYLMNYDMTLAQMDGAVDLVGTASDWLDAWTNAKNGVFYPMTDDMLKKYAPKTYASVSKEHWDMCRMDGKIYMMPEDNYTQWINHGFMYRGDWAKQAELNGVHSWEDLTSYFEYVRKAKPDIIPWNSTGGLSSFHGEGYIQSKSDFVPLEGLSTNLIFGVRRGNLKKVYSPFLEGEELVEYARLMKHWDTIGVWPKNVLANSSSDNRDEFIAGKTAVEQHHTQTWYTLVRPAMQESIPGSDCEFFWFGEEAGNVTSMTITHGAMALSAASPNPERALMVYDLLRNDPECYALINYGIEGRQYEKTSDGFRVRPSGYDNARDAISANFWWGRNDSLEIRDKAGAWDKFDEINKIYNAVKIDYPYSQVVWDLSGITSEMSAISDVWGEYMPGICYGKSNDPEKYVSEFRNALRRAGIERVISELQKQLDSYNLKK